MLDMPQLLYVKKLQAARLHPTYIKSCYMPRLLYAEKLQAACRAVAEYALINQRMLLVEMQRRKTDETRHEGPEGALLFLRATSKIQR
jgi:hypothetical protein